MKTKVPRSFNKIKRCNYALLINLKFNKIKKIILGIVFVFATVSFTNAKTNVEKNDNINQVVLANGTPSDCVQSSRNATLALASAYGWDANGGDKDFALEVYKIIYMDCLQN